MMLKYSAPVVLAVVALGACAAKQAAVTSVPAASAPVTATAPAPTQTTVTAAAPAGTARQPVIAAAPASRAFIDPVTGELRAPTAEELSAVAASATAGAAGKSVKAVTPIEEVALPDGSTMARFGDRAMVEERVCLQKDGTLTSKCPTEKATRSPLKAGKP